MAKISVAVLGLGIMGAGMARRLQATGFPVTVWNRNPEKSKAFGDAARATPAEAAKGADLIIAMVADDTASRSVWMGGDGALAAAKPGAVIMESGTLTIGWIRELAAAAKAKGLGFIDAPVTGSKVQAEEGTMRFLVGGEAGDVAKVQPALDVMSTETIHLGPVGSGITMKLINNFLCGVQVATIAEALAIAERAGLDTAKVSNVLGNGAPGSPLVKAIIGRIAEKHYAPNFFPGLMAKDLEYSGLEAANLGISLETAAAARKRFLAAVDAGHGEKDIAAVIEPLRK